MAQFILRSFFIISNLPLLFEPIAMLINIDEHEAISLAISGTGFRFELS